ncbi:transcription-repair coupling factor [Acholeplasma hippikon]|uniref:Transcription-repair-coupling factor n=1 Tax=Acholeplasma hippikon TaxID=264636 RepID=A0A449BL08_9MOLU|nr:transcription-repair coupling factor [Acholeplasma hippikon]VEU83017.1 excinuclease ABC subunit B [Acholeplasma hippikon]
MYEKLLKLYNKTNQIKASQSDFKNVNHAYVQFLITLKYYQNNKNIFVVLPNLYDAQKYYDKLSNILGDECVLFYPSDQMLTSMMALGSPEFKNERLFTLRKLLKNEQKYVVVTTQEGILKRQLKPQDYENSVMTLYKNGSYDFQSLIKRLVYDGYQYNFTVERPGEFSVRGSIIDIFTHDHKDPFRIDFFGDEIESIKTFDVLTQKSIESVDKIDLAPLHELFYTDKQKEVALKQFESFFENIDLSEKEINKYNTDFENLKNRKRMDSLSLYTSFFNSDETTILDFGNRNEIILVDKYKMLINEESNQQDLKTYSETMFGDTFTKLPFRLNLDYILNKDHLSFELYYAADVITEDLKVFDVEGFQGFLEPFLMFLNEYKAFTVICAMNGKVNYEKLKEFLSSHKVNFNDNDIKPGELNIMHSGLPGSFLDTQNKVVVLTDESLFTSKQTGRIRYRSVINQAIKIRDASELKEGDYVVHYDFGIGQYLGLKTMSLSGEKRDYLHIIYENNEALYVPTDQIELVLKYRRGDDLPPKLSKLSGKQWGKTKAAVRKKIKDLSDRLLKLYAMRKEAKGFAFSRDNEMMEQFENDFNYEETKDQKLAIEAVKKDMENERPMDRLIAGDVGFGKTEVALRAAFKATLDAKQVAYLVPTTVLARQHYYSFKERFEKYGGNVALLSRYVSKKEQNEILDKLAKGYIDVVIGTHRLLSDDVKFKDLGLFIIDEEQRFGVEHKEKIKEMKVNVDTLTLSATPIPRTLQMAMYGLKDLSMIETPPMNRYPVQTYVVERQDVIIKDAIDRELARGGQVFYLYNRVETIEAIMAKIQKLVPNARIATAHGKMSKDKLEEVLQAFIEKEFDVLVSTTIIETGVDIPNTNTLIIHDADKLGLSQLYQLRGRVGRSDKIAYAYLMFDAYKNINDEAKKRLSVIEDFTDLGSGFKIALRDLAIRGAGDILGDEQSGFIDSVGMEMYMKLLDEVMNGIMEDPVKSQVPDQVFASRHIPKEYIDNDPVRIEIHKRIAALNSLKDLEDLKLELEDRFGQIDLEVLIYMHEKLFKKLSSKVGIEKTVRESDSVRMIFSLDQSEKVDGIKLLYAATNSKTKVSLADKRGHVEVNMITRGHKEHWLYLACELLESYLKTDINQSIIS